MTQTDDFDILARYARDHSHEAFAHLVAKYSGLVFQTAFRRTRNRALAEDVTQAVFIVLARRAAHLTRRDSLAAWLHKTTLYASGTALRAELRRRKHENSAAQPEFTEQSSSDDFDLLTAIDSALLRLPTKDRQLISLHYLEERTYEQIASTFAITPEAARKRIARALDHLRKKLTTRSVTTAALVGGLTAMNTSFSHSSAATIASTAVAGGQSTNAFTLANSTINAFKLLALLKPAAAVVAILSIASAVTVAQLSPQPKLAIATNSPTTAPAGKPMVLELTGTRGAEVTGFYVVNSRLTPINAILPATITARGMVGTVISKRDRRSTLAVHAKGDNGEIYMSSAAGNNEAIRLDFEGGYSGGMIPASVALQKIPATMPITLLIQRVNGRWTIGDPSRLLENTPLPDGTAAIVDSLARKFPDATLLNLQVSDHDFPGSQLKLIRLRADSDGEHYRCDSPQAECVLSLALFRYFDQAPANLFISATPPK